MGAHGKAKQLGQRGQGQLAEEGGQWQGGPATGQPGDQSCCSICRVGMRYRPWKHPIKLKLYKSVHYKPKFKYLIIKKNLKVRLLNQPFTKY